MKHLQTNLSFLILISALSGVSPVHASYPEMTVLADYCMVEIRTGNGGTVGQNLPVTYTGRATAGQNFKGREGEQVCMRRENQPGVCSSGLEKDYYCIKGWDGLSVGQPDEGSH